MPWVQTQTVCVRNKPPHWNTNCGEPGRPEPPKSTLQAMWTQELNVSKQTCVREYKHLFQCWIETKPSWIRVTHSLVWWALLVFIEQLVFLTSLCMPFFSLKICERETPLLFSDCWWLLFCLSFNDEILFNETSVEYYWICVWILLTRTWVKIQHTYPIVFNRAPESNLKSSTIVFLKSIQIKFHNSSQFYSTFCSISLQKWAQII